jgi:HD-like signal output (HDOD) protein
LRPITADETAALVAPPAMLDIEAPPPPTVDHRSQQRWVQRFLRSALPVLRETALALEDLRICEDEVDARTIADTLAGDPLMTLKILAHAANVHPERRCADAETVTEALVLIGITPFFRAFGPQVTVEDRLVDRPQALAGLLQVLRRSHRAAEFALAFAVQRMDHDAAVIHEAALLHDFAEILLWLEEPAIALEIQQRQQADPTLRSPAIQRELLQAELADIGHALMQAWHLPRLLLRISDDRHADSAPVKNVLLAIRLARHSANGWDNPALPDDVRDIAALLGLGVEPTWQLLQDVDPV